MDLHVLEFNLHSKQILNKISQIQPLDLLLTSFIPWARYLRSPSLWKMGLWQHGPSYLLKRALFYYVYIMDPSDMILAKG